MEITKANQNQNLPTMHSTGSLPPSTRKKIAVLIRQSFDIFNTFGLTPQQLESRAHAFGIALSGYTEPQIEEGFNEWLQCGKTMPTPADIIEIINENAKRRSYLNGPRPVSWSGKRWNQITPEIIEEIKEYLLEIPEDERSEYYKYLINQREFQLEFTLEDLGND